MGAGVLLGTSVGLAMLMGVRINGLPWLAAVGLVKLTIVAAVGMIGAGATMHRLAGRKDARDRLRAGPDQD